MAISPTNPAGAGQIYNLIQSQANTTVNINAPQNANINLQVNSAQGADSVQISIGAQQTRAVNVLQDRILTSLETQVPDVFEEAGRAEFLQSIENANDQSPEAVAGRIFDGVTGFIFNAFVNQNPDFTEEELTAFRDEVVTGVEQGVSEAREILSALEALNPEVDSTINETVDILTERLDSFFEELFEQFETDDDVNESTTETSETGTPLDSSSQQSSGLASA